MWLTVANFLMQAFFVLAAVYVVLVKNVPINLQQEKCHFLFYNFLKIIPLKRMDYHIYISGYSILLERCRASMSKHRQQNTRVKAKGIDQIWSQICFSVTKSLKESIFSEP